MSFLRRVRDRLTGGFGEAPDRLDRLTWDRPAVDGWEVDPATARDVLRELAADAPPPEVFVDPDACAHCLRMLCDAFPDCPPEAPHMRDELPGGPA